VRYYGDCTLSEDNIGSSRRVEILIALIDEFIIILLILIGIFGALVYFNKVSLGLAILLVACLAGFSFFVIYLIYRAQVMKPLVGGESLIGKRGIVVGDLAPEGIVSIEGELWRAVSVNGKHISSGRFVRVVGTQGLNLLVEELDERHIEKSLS